MCEKGLRQNIGSVIPLYPSDVAVVILNFCGGSDTIACLQALYATKEPPLCIIVVDNESRDGSPENILENWSYLADTVVRACPSNIPSNPSAVLLDMPENGGYATGNNAGIRLAMQNPSCRAVWILNNDTEPDASSLQKLCGRLNSSPMAGMVGSTLVYAHDREAVQCAGGFSFNKYTGATPALHGNERLSAVLRLDPAIVEGKLGYLCGASMLVRREVFERIGYFAEEYFLYYEDAEFGLRAQKAGYVQAWAPDSIVFHKEGGSTGAKSSGARRSVERSESMDYLTLRNRIYLVRQSFPILVPFAILSYAGVLLNRLRRNQTRRIPLVLRALWDGLSGEMGKPEFFAPSEEKTLRVLFLTVRADFGGGPEHLWQLLQHVPTSVRPYVACPRDYPYYERYRKIVGSAHIVTLPHRFFSLRKFWQLWCFCREHNISVLHSHGKGAGLYSRILAVLTGMPCVCTFHGVHMNSYKPIKRYVYRLYEYCMSLFTHVGIAVSEGEKTQIIAERLMPVSKLRLIPNGVKVTGNRVTEKSLAPPYVVVTLSRFDYQKNGLFLLDIAKELDTRGRLREFQLVAVGDGADRQTVTSAALAHGWERVVLCPGASTQPHSFFESALCYLSTSRWEGMPLAVLEAMAHGLPVVASNVVGNQDAVSHGTTGFLYPEGDAVAAATALCHFADDFGLRCTMGNNAREYILRNHLVEDMATRTFDVLKNISP